MARRRFLSQLLGLPFLALGTKAQESKKTLRILMRSSWGTDDPTRAVRLRACTGLGGRWPRSSDIPDCRRELSYAQSYLGRADSHWLAAPQRVAREGRRQTHSCLCLRSLLPGPWGLGKRSRELERQVRQSCYFRFSGRMG